MTRYMCEVSWNGRVMIKLHGEVRYAMEDFRGWRYFFEGIEGCRLRVVGDFRVIEDVTFKDSVWVRADYLEGQPTEDTF